MHWIFSFDFWWKQFPFTISSISKSIINIQRQASTKKISIMLFFLTCYGLNIMNEWKYPLCREQNSVNNCIGKVETWSVSRGTFIDKLCILDFVQPCWIGSDIKKYLFELLAQGGIFTGTCSFSIFKFFLYLQKMLAPFRIAT